MYIERKMGCRLPWNDLQSDFPNTDEYKCKKQGDIQKFFEISNQFHTATNLGIVELTNCLPDCRFNEYKVLKKYGNTLENYVPKEFMNMR